LLRGLLLASLLAGCGTGVSATIVKTAELPGKPPTTRYQMTITLQNAGHEPAWFVLVQGAPAEFAGQAPVDAGELFAFQEGDVPFVRLYGAREVVVFQVPAKSRLTMERWEAGLSDPAEVVACRVQPPSLGADPLTFAGKAGHVRNAGASRLVKALPIPMSVQLHAVVYDCRTFSLAIGAAK